MAKQFEYNQQLAHLKMTVADIKSMLDNKPVEYAYIIHDKDDTEPHIHVMVRLLNSNMSPKDLCKWFKDEPQYINIKQSRWGSKLSYLVHRTPNDSDKFQYDPNDVVANFNYPETLEKITKQVETANNIDRIIDNIQIGKIREYNLTEYVDAHIYAKFKPRIINALEWYRRKVMTDKNRDIKVIIFTGDTGTGKTTYAKRFCENQHKTYCVSSSSNDPMQDYKGEDVLILDDIRDSTFKFSDLLKILDNHTNSTVASRYNNKAFIGDTIILTSAIPLKQWYENKTDEDRAQLYRRIPEWLTFDRADIRAYEYDENKRAYVFVYKVPNIIKETVKQTKMRMIDTLTAMGIEVTEDMKQAILKPTEDDEKTVEEVLDDKDLPF